MPKPRPNRRARREQEQAEPEGYALKFFFSPFLLIGWLTKRLPTWLKWPVRMGGGLAVIGVVCLLILTVVYAVFAANYNIADVEEMPARSTILDRDGGEIGYLHGKNRHLIKYEDVSPFFINALIAREDARFRDHGAIDLRGIGRSIFRFVTRGKTEGASTLTMQLARNSYDLKHREHNMLQSLHRKALEIAIAYRIENNYSKNEIIQHYMNRIFWGGSILGVEAAARQYFGKSANDLNLSESALLAGIIRAPNAFSPFKDLEAAKFERDTVLNRMAEYKIIDETTRDRIKAEPIIVRDSAHRLIKRNYAIDAIRRDLEVILEQQNIKRGGLIINTTLDTNLQTAAERALESRLSAIENTPGFNHQTRQDFLKAKKGEPAYLQGAAVVIENQTGAVLAIVGGRNASESEFNRALQAKRSVGSIFKPFVYMAAFNKGLKPNELVSDARIQPGEIAGAPAKWSPTNSDGKYYKSVTVADALISSRNTSTIRVGSIAGVEYVTEIARLAGFNEKAIQPVPASYLGPWEATPMQVTSAYTIFPNNGVRFRPYFISSITDRHGNVLWKNGPMAYAAANSDTTSTVSHLLEQVNEQGTGQAVTRTYGFRAPSAGKTGTTDNYTDAWYAGYTSRLSCAVWVGMDQPQRIISGGYGSRLALPIWVDIMKTAERLGTYPFKSLQRPTAARAVTIAEAAEPEESKPAPKAILVPEDASIPRAIPLPEN